MLTNEDIQKMMEVFPTKDDLKEAVANLVTKDDFNDLQTSVDAYAKKADIFFQKWLCWPNKISSTFFICRLAKQAVFIWFKLKSVLFWNINIWWIKK